MKALRCLGTGLVFLIAGLIFIACVVAPTVLLVGERFTLAGMIDQAQAIRLVNNGGPHNEAPASTDLARDRFHHVLSAFPYAPDVGLPRVTDDSRFKPDHEIVITDNRGDETDVRISFATSHVEIGDGPVLRTPYVWRVTLRWFFSHQMKPVESAR